MSDYTLDARARFETKAAAEADPDWLVFEGVASTDRPGDDVTGDVIAAGAFEPINPRNVALLWAHDSRTPIGRWTSLRQVGRDLIGCGQIYKRLERGAEVATLLVQGLVNGLSVGFSVLNPEKDIAYSGNKRSGRVIKTAKLCEVSIVSLPANTAARVQIIRSVGPANTLGEANAHAAAMQLGLAKFAAQSHLIGDRLIGMQLAFAERLTKAAQDGALSPEMGRATLTLLKDLQADLRTRRAV